MARSAFKITADAARTMARFEFLAHWLELETRKKANRGPLGLYVKRVGKEWRIYSPIAGGTVMFSSPDSSLLYDYARRTQLGSIIREAEGYRVDAFAEKSGWPNLDVSGRPK